MDSRTPISVRTKRVASLVRHAHLRLYSIEGQFDGAAMRLLVADDGSVLPYMRSLVFPEGSAAKLIGKIPAARAARLSEADADIVVVGANLLLANQYSKSGFHLVPKWVRLFLPSHEDPYVRLYEQGRQARKYFKWMLKKVKDEGFVCESTNDPHWLQRFYWEMYKPYAEQRYGELAIVHSYDKIKSAFSRGAGIVVKKDDTPVAGSVIAFAGTTVRIPHVGVVGGDMAVVRDGAAFAMDYYVAQMAHSCGYAYVDFGHSRPFASDGALKYKLNWHMEVRDDDDAIGLFAIAAPGRTEQAMKFLSQNRFLELSNDGVRLCDAYQQVDVDPN